MTGTDGSARRIVFVTGPSGAGRSSALNVLEDAGFETVDNLPLRLLDTLISQGPQDRPLALGIDPRNRDFSTTAVTDILGQLARTEGLAPELLYLDCSTEVLLRRYSSTRRRHPLAPDDRPAEGILRELEMMGPLRARADVLIDTSELNIHQLRSEVEHWFVPDGQHRLRQSVKPAIYPLNNFPAKQVFA